MKYPSNRSYRCIYCGVIWTKLKDAMNHAEFCKKVTQ